MNKFFFLILFPIIALAESLTPEQKILSDKLTSALKKQDATLFKSLIHSKCPVDEKKIKSNTVIAWSESIQVRFKKVEDSFDRKLIKFVVEPTLALELQDEMRLKAFAVAPEGKELKILEWPCFEMK